MELEVTVLETEEFYLLHKLLYKQMFLLIPDPVILLDKNPEQHLRNEKESFEMFNAKTIFSLVKQSFCRKVNVLAVSSDVSNLSEVSVYPARLVYLCPGKKYSELTATQNTKTRNAVTQRNGLA